LSVQTVSISCGTAETGVTQVQWGKGGSGTLDAIVPIKTVVPQTYTVLKTLIRHPGIRTVFIPIDPRMPARDVQFLQGLRDIFERITISPGQVGKGQNVLSIVNLTSTARLLFCDADYMGLTHTHLSELLLPENGMIIGVPMFPENVPDHVIRSWPWVSGLRVVPREVIPKNLHGYLMEHQLNRAARNAGLIVSHRFCWGLKSPFVWPLPTERFNELISDRLWGSANGVFEEIVTGESAG
jgi:hypothetical protein